MYDDILNFEIHNTDVGKNGHIFPHLNISSVLFLNKFAISKGSDESAHMRSLVKLSLLAHTKY